MPLTYRLDVGSAAIAQTFDVEAGRDAWEGGPISPGQFAPVIARAGKQGERLIRPMHWGYPAPGQSSHFAGSDPIRWVSTVRNLESPFWIGNLRHSELRCLIPATSFSVGTGKKRDWYHISDAPTFAFAGIWCDLTDMPVFAILCTEAAKEFSNVSMPVILPASVQNEWLSVDWKTARALVRPSSAHRLDIGR
ncbi:MAG: SOS response-associated peptidase family protein [Sphingorhabdus sp.]